MMAPPPLRAPTPSPTIANNSHFEEAQAVQLWHQARKKTIILQLELWSSRHKMKKKNKNDK